MLLTVLALISQHNPAFFFLGFTAKGGDMMEVFFAKQETWNRLRFGPLAPYLDQFAARLRDQGYAKTTAQLKIRLVASLSRWLYRQRLRAEDLDEHKANTFLQSTGRVHLGYASSLKILLALLREKGVIPWRRHECKVSQIENLVQEFTRYMHNERGLSSTTITRLGPLVHSFLSYRFKSGPVILDKLNPPDIAKFILHQCRTFSPGHAKVTANALRTFFRFLLQRGKIDVDLTCSVPSIADWRLSRLPKYLESNQMEHLLRKCNRNTPAGKRDFAILLLLARLGLRAGEIVSMRLDDIDWEAGTLTIRGKGQREDLLPIPQDVGEAIVAYLRHVRPRCTSRRVFVRSRAPHRGFTCHRAISALVRRAMGRAGLCLPHMGAHVLRHSFATLMLRKGASLAEIGEILRHRLPDTTEIYAKVDLDALRPLAQPWPGGVS